MAPLREPNKLQRLGEAVVTSLPYHPEYIDQGTVFDTALLAPVTVLVPVRLIRRLRKLRATISTFTS